MCIVHTSQHTCILFCTCSLAHPPLPPPVHCRYSRRSPTPPHTSWAVGLRRDCPSSVSRLHQSVVTCTQLEESLLTGWRLDSPPTVYWVSLGACCALVEDRTGRSAVTCSVCVVFSVCCVVSPLVPVEGYDPGLPAVQTHMLAHCTVHGAVSGSPPGHTVHNPS